MTYHRFPASKTILPKHIEYKITRKTCGGVGPDIADDIILQTRESGPENAAYLKKHQKEAWLYRLIVCTNPLQYTLACEKCFPNNLFLLKNFLKKCFLTQQLNNEFQVLKNFYDVSVMF